ncbi:E3 ubiquitin-protein ligase NEDD4-like isoform X2 [Clytia hemisphaerica]|uniref:E3 ubiquitin-protein ligase n=1 Tax=Clytia hemisphaerica TaxID=252671 RepID=A0A7M5V1B1_9CNID
MSLPPNIDRSELRGEGQSIHVSEEGYDVFKVRIVGAKNLAKKDIFGLSDPYCMIKLFHDRENPFDKFNTSTVKKTLNPKWDFEFHCLVKTDRDKMLLEIFDENRVTRDDFLGETEIPFSNDVDDAPRDYLLHRRSHKSRVRGHIMVSIEKIDTGAHDETDGSAARHIARDLVNLMERDISHGPPSLETGFESVSLQDAAEAEAEVRARDRDNSVRRHISSSTSRQSSRTSSIRQPEPDPLPEGWEERQDANGRIFFVNHTSRSTTWTRPTVDTPTEERRRPFDDAMNIRRHISMDDTVSESSSTPTTPTSQDVEEPLPPGWEERRNVNGQTLYIDHNSRTTTWNRPSSSNQLEPSTPVASAPAPEESESPPPPEEPEDEQSASTVERLHPDIPSQSEMPLPAGWAMQLAPNNRVFFVDHNNRTTSWVDPRVNTQPATQDLGPLPAGWEERVHFDGRVFFIDHDTQSTQWEDPRLQTVAKQKSEALPYSRDYKRKYDFFRSRLKRPDNVPNKYEIHVRRTSIMDDSFRFVLSQCTKVDLLKTKLWIVFDGEAGLDYGGVAREWFYLLSKEIFNPYYGLFEYSATDNYTLQINPNSGMCNDDHLRYFKFIGRVAGMAVYHGKLLDAFFIRPFYKMMLNKKITLTDLESVDSEYHNSLVWLLENDPEDLDLRFQVEEEVFGEVVSRDLKPGGEDIPVTNANKREYIDSVIRWRFMDRINEQMKSFMQGFRDIIPQTLIQVFDDRELEYLMCGLGEIDSDDWRKHTQYRGGYHDKHVVIQWFWKAVITFDKEMRARLLQFVTGTSRVPMNGFAELYGSNGPQKFAIERWGNPHQLPRAHTCFNRLDLPNYGSYHELREKLRLAIENTEGFEGVD